MLIYVPLEHIEGRYTVHMDRDIEAYLNAQDIEYVKVMPTTETPPLPEGQFLNAAFTSKFKAMQIAEIIMIHSGLSFSRTFLNRVGIMKKTKNLL